jgi:hypothetical protein
MNCGEIREMAGHHLCFKCYRRDERADDRKFGGVDRHSPGIRREHKKLFRGLTGMMVGLSDLGVSNADVLRIRRIIDGYLSPIAKFLTPASASEDVGVEVNGEQQPGIRFTVHSGTDAVAPETPTEQTCTDDQ